MNDFFKDKTAVVTGGSGGIGAAVVRGLCSKVSRVIVAGVDDEEKCGALVEETGAQCEFLDIRNRVDVMDVLSGLEVDILVNAAGALGLTGTLFDQDPESAQRVVDVNIIGLQNCLQAIVPGMIERNDGHVVLIGSIAGPYPSLGQPVYSATKAAVHLMAANLRLELFGSRVRVTEIRPGRVRTGMHAEMFDGNHEEANKIAYDSVVTLEPEDIAEGIIWALAKPAHICVSQLEILATDHVIGGIQYKPKE